MVKRGHHDEETATPPAIREVKARHEERLLSMPGVVSVGIGKSRDGNPVIIVGLDRHRAETILEIPGELEGYLVRVDITGSIRALENPLLRRNIKS